MLVILNSASFSFAAVNQSSPEKINSFSVETQYFSLAIDEYKLPVKKPNLAYEAVGGGAIAKINETELFYISSYGESKFIQIRDNVTVTGSSPPYIDTGATHFYLTKRFSLIETSPRILGAFYYDGYIYVSYNKYNKGKDEITFNIASVKIGDSENWKNLWESAPLEAGYFTIGNGGKIVITNKTMFFTVGDQSLDRYNGLPSDFAPQNPKQPWGKIYKVNLESRGFVPELCSIGHRNPQGITFYRGVLYETEHGPRGGDEINVITCGLNYGWPFESYGTNYGSYVKSEKSFFSRVRSCIRHFDFKMLFNSFSNTEPLYYFTPSIAISGITNSKIWPDDLVIGSLKATSLFRINLNEYGFVKNIEQIPVGARIRDLLPLGDRLIALTDNSSILLIAKDSLAPLNANQNSFPSLTPCLSACHKINSNSEDTAFAPNLQGVYGGRIGKSAKYNYSKNFSKFENVKWGDENLRKFLTDPNNYIPGTKMPNFGYSEDKITNIISDLKKIGVAPQ